MQRKRISYERGRPPRREGLPSNGRPPDRYGGQPPDRGEAPGGGGPPDDGGPLNGNGGPPRCPNRRGPQDLEDLLDQ